MGNRLSAVLDAEERAGRLTLTTEQIAKLLPGVSAAALRQTLYRQQMRGRLARLSRGAGQWLIVPLMHAESGAPPLEAWLHRYMSAALEVPYYVGLLSAAETYGIAPYAVTVTQVMVPIQRRPVTVGRQRLVFHTRTNITAMPTQWHETPEGRFRVSTPELTMLELVRRQDLAGGLARVRDVVRGLAALARAEGLAIALEACEDIPPAQRLGAILAIEGSDLADAVAAWLHGKPKRTVSLATGLKGTLELDSVFRVLRPVHLADSGV
ncbi:MAG TPA: type IV toxin-antitoxin system AbiEi family antitoxin [Steroidobacteraceae bacterium]|nr:type IV toxin-antitoxin system AbiEi family antitoxin [Steroidobacteraceae bacterium]